MPSILSIPTAEIPFHFLCFPITQCETLLAHVLTHPHLSRALVETAFNQGNPVLQQFFPLFYSYVIVSLISFCLVVSLVFLEIPKALDTGLSTACPAIFVLLVDQGLDRAMEQLHRDELRPLLCTILLSLSEEQWQAYYQELLEAWVAGPEGAQPVQTANGERTTLSPSPGPAGDPCSPHPARDSSPTDSLTFYSSTEMHVAHLAQTVLHIAYQRTPRYF